MRESGVKPQYVMRLDERKQVAGRCYWPVEVRADRALWRRYLISPDGWKVVSE